MGRIAEAAEGMMSLTPGKIKGLEVIADARGVIAAAAMDQRGSLEKILRDAGLAEVTPAAMTEFKIQVTEILSPYASSLLLDPVYGLPAIPARAPGTGLLLAYEQWGYDDTLPGRLPELLPHQSVQRLKAAGADAIKILLYYNPFEDDVINDQKQAWVERIGDECRANDIPFLLEFIGYDPAGGDEKSPAFARRKPEIVRESMREFSRDRYGVDVLKVEIPVNMQYVAGTNSFTGTEVYTRAEALEHFRAAAQAASKPFIYLSAGVGTAQFIESLQLAAEAGVPFSGVLAGRATWQDGAPVYVREGVGAFRRWLEAEGVRNIEAINHQLRRAVGWQTVWAEAAQQELPDRETAEVEV